MEKQIRVLQLDTEKTWRGGQQQAIYLHKGLLDRNIESMFICQPDSALSKYCRENSLPCETIRIRGEADILAARKIVKICNSKEYNIIHCHSAHALSIGLTVKYMKKDIRLIAARRVDFHVGKNILSRYKYNNEMIDAIVCISDKIRNVLIDDGINEDKLITIRSGIDITKFNNINTSGKLREELGLSADDFIVGTIAAFAGHKDYYNLVNAAKIILETNKKVKFLWVGDGELLHGIKIKVQDLGIEDNIVFAGHRNNIGEFLRLFDIFVLASRKEGLGTSILDAQAAGLPVVATRTGGIPEIIEHDKNGLLAEPKNPPELADAISLLIKDSQKREMLGQAAQMSVSKFDINITVESNLQLYKTLLG